MKKEVASRVQSSLALSSAETVLLKDNIRNKNAPALSSSSDSCKLAKAKFETIGTILGAANWIEILREHVAKSLREPVPDMASIFHTLELLGKINIHGVVDGACKLHAAAIWDRRSEILAIANLPANVTARLCSLLPAGPGAFQGKFLELAKLSAEERKESKELRDVSDNSELRREIARMRQSMQNIRPRGSNTGRLRGNSGGSRRAKPSHRGVGRGNSSFRGGARQANYSQDYTPHFTPASESTPSANKFQKDDNKRGSFRGNRAGRFNRSR
jgi:hypothetical protein